MATQVPASLRQADITRFAFRAAQLESAKPVVAYWCDYWIVNQILQKGLHNADQEALVYTTNLMDKLEKFKTENSTNDTVIDDVAGKAYVEQFGLETFARADNAVRANKASKQTADAFQAAATFLDLLAIWGALEPDISAKVKFAKFHALRILKAIKAGEDPNLSNPAPEPEPEDVLPTLDPNDAEVQALEGRIPKPRQPSVVEVPDEAHRLQRGLAQRSSLDESLHPSRDTSMPPAIRPRQASVVEVPDEAHKLQANLARLSSKDESLHPSRAPSAPHSPGHAISPITMDPTSFYTDTGNHAQAPTKPGDISPISTGERKSSLGGNYFPRVPSPQSSQAHTDTTERGGFELPSAPTDYNATDASSTSPSLPEPPTTFTSSQPAPPRTPLDSFLPPPLPGQPALSNVPPNLMPSSSSAQSKPIKPPQLSSNIPTQPAPPTSRSQYPSQTPAPTPAAAAAIPRPQPQQHAPSSPPPPPPAATNVVVDEEAVLKAQKHARWAISALNFEDVPTAVREFQAALRTLGA